MTSVRDPLLDPENKVQIAATIITIDIGMLIPRLDPGRRARTVIMSDARGHSTQRLAMNHEIADTTLSVTILAPVRIGGHLRLVILVIEDEMQISWGVGMSIKIRLYV